MRLLLFLVACKGDGLASSGVEIVNEGSGEPNTLPLHPLTRGQTWIYAGQTVRVGDTFLRDGRELVRVTVGAFAENQEVWLHRDEDGVWLDGGSADGLLETPIWVAPEPVRAGMHWEQRFRLGGDEVAVTGWVERDPEDPTRWVINRQQNDRDPTATPYTEGLGPHEPRFVPFDPPAVEPVPEEAVLQASLVQGEAPFIEAVAFTEDSTRATGGMLRTTVVYDPYGQLPPRAETQEVGLFAFPGELPLEADELVERPTGPLPGPDDGYLRRTQPWTAGDGAFVWTGEDWIVRDRIAPTPSRVRLADGPTRWIDAHDGGTIDVVALEDGALVRRRLGRLALDEGRHLRSAWPRLDGVWEGIQVAGNDPLDGVAESFVLQGVPDTGPVVPLRPDVRVVRWDGDVEVCWTGDGEGADWLLDGAPPAKVVPTGRSCALLVRDWTSAPLDVGSGYELEGTIGGIGPFWLQGYAQATLPVGFGRRVRQPDGTLVDVDGRTLPRPGGLTAGTIDWPERCIPDAVEGCWLVDTVANGVELTHVGADGEALVASIPAPNPNPATLPTGGLMLNAQYGTNERVWVRADGTQQTFTWEPSGYVAESFDGSTLCFVRPGDVALECRDLATGQVLYSVDRAEFEMASAHPLADGRLLLWPYNGTARVLDRTTWTTTEIPGAVDGVQVGGLLSDGTVWGWRPHPTVFGDRQLVRVTDQVEVASFPMSLEDRNAVVDGQSFSLFADDDLVYWVGGRTSPSVLSQVVRMPWDALTWEAP